jgi:hypothetical protein
MQHNHGIYRNNYIHRGIKITVFICFFGLKKKHITLNSFFLLGLNFLFDKEIGIQVLPNLSAVLKSRARVRKQTPYSNFCITASNIGKPQLFTPTNNIHCASVLMGNQVIIQFARFVA